MMDLEDPTRMEYEIVVPVKPLPSSDKPLKGLLKRNKCDSNSSSSSSSSSEKDGKAKRRVKFAETMMVFCDDWPQEVMPQIIALKSPTDFNLIEIVASGFMFDPPVEYQDLLPFDPPPDYQDCVSSNKHPSIIPMSSYEKDSSISFIDDDDQCESDEFVNDYHNQLNSSLHWENILNESEILEEDIIGVLKEDEILQAIGSQTADIDTVFHPMESEENFSETDFPVHYQNGQFIQQSQGFNSNVNSIGHSSSDEGYHVVDGYCDRINQATETSETYSEAEELSSDLASDSSFTSQDTIILTTPLASDPNSLCRNDFHPSSSSADSLLSPGKTVVTYVDQYSDYTQLDVNLEFESKLNKPVLETINDEEEEVRSEADIGSISEDRSSLNESTLEDVNKVNSDNYRSKSSNETSGKDDCTTSIEGDDGDDDIVSEADNSLNQGEGSCNINEVNTVIRKEDKEGDFNADDESNQSTGNNENYMSDIHGAIRNDSIGSKILNTNNNEPVNQLNEVSESMNTRPLARTGPVNECPEGSVKSVSLAKPLPAPSSLTSSPSSLNASSTTMSSSSSPIQSSIIGPTTVVSSSTFIPTQSASVVNTCGSNVVVIGLVDCEGINKSTNHPQQLLTAVPVNATSVSVSAIRKAFEVKHESEAPLYENTTEMRNKTKNTSQPAPARPKSFPFSNFKLGKSVEPNKNNYNSVNNSTSTNSSSTSNINNNANVGNNSNQSGSSGSSLIKEATNVMTEKLKWLTLHGGGDSSKQLTNDESGKTAQPSTSSTTTINENKSKQSQQQQQQQQQHQQQPQPQRSKEDLIIEYTSEPRGAQQVKRVSLTEAALKAATCNNTKGVNTLPGNPSSAQIVSHYHHLHHHHGQGITSHQIVHPSHQQPHLHHQQQPLAIPVNHLQFFPPGTNIPASISTMGTAHQIVHHPAHPPASIQHLGPTPQQIQLVKSAPSVISSSASSAQFIIPSTPQQQSPNQIQSQPPPQSQQQANAPQYHIYPVTKCRAASPQFINQYYTTTTPGGQRQLVYVSHVAPGQQFMTSQTIHHHPHIHPHLHLQQHQQPQPQQSQTSGQTIHGQPTPIQPGTVTMVSGAPQGSRETPSPSIIQLHCRPGSAMSNSSIVGSRIYAQPLQHGFVAVPKDSSFPNPSEIRRRDGLNAYPIVKEDPLNVVNTSNGSTTNGSSPTASSLSSASSSSSSSISPSSSSTTSTVPNSTNSKSGNSSDSTNLTSSDTKDELEQFVENDIQRIERIKRRYSLTEEGDDPTFGFGRRPSVRGIKPKYGPSEIIRHMQMQLRPSVQSVAPQTLPKQAKVINTQIVNESTNLVSSASSHGLTTSLSTITTATPVILTSGSVSSQSSSSQVPRTAQIHLITRHSHSHSHCHPHLISASQVGSVPNLRQHLVSSTSSISPSSSSTSSPSPSGHNTIGHRHVYLIPHVQGGPQYQRIVQAAGATLPRPHPGQQQGQSQHQPSTGLTQQLSAQQAAMLMMKQIGGRVKIINGSQSAGSIGIVGNQPPLSRPASSLGHIIQRGSGDAELRLTPQSSASSSSDVTCKQCPVRPAGSMEPQPGQPQSITIISNKVGPCLLQHKTISMPNVSLIKSLPQTLTVVPINDIKDERGAPEGASASPTHSSDKDFVESNKATKSVDANADTMSTGSTSSCSSSTSSANTGTPSSNNNLIVNNNNNNFNNTKNNNDVNNSTSNSNNPNNTNANNNNNNDNDDITEKNNNNNNTNNLTNSNNNVNTNNNINNNMNNNPDLVKDATTSALKAKKTIASDMKDGKSKPVSSKDGVIYYSMNV